MRLSLALVFVVALSGCGPRQQQQAPPPPMVTVAKPLVKEVAEYLEFTGKTRATDVVDIRARVNGYLKKVAFTDGALVKQGDTLFQIETDPFDAALASAKAKLQKAEAVLSLAEAELKRTEPLVEKGALPEQERDIKKADLATAKAEVAEAKASLQQAELNLRYTTVVAPISGRAGRHMVDVGNLVQAEQTVLSRLEGYRPIHAYFTISESEMVQLMDVARKKKATPATEKKSPTELELSLATEQGFPYRGELDFTELGIEPGTGTQERRGIFPNDNLELVPGMFVRVRLKLEEAKPRLLVSERALAGDQQGAYLLVVEKDVVKKRHVKFGMAIDGLRVIHQGLNPEDLVIIRGMQRARPDDPNAKVTPVVEVMQARPGTSVAAQPTGTLAAAQPSSIPGAQSTAPPHSQKD